MKALWITLVTTTVGATEAEVSLPLYPFNWKSNCTTLLQHMNEIRAWGHANSQSNIEIRRVPLYDWEEVIVFKKPNSRIAKLPAPSDLEIVELRKQNEIPAFAPMVDARGHPLLVFRNGSSPVYFANQKTDHEAYSHFWRSIGHLHMTTMLMAISDEQFALTSNELPKRSMKVFSDLLGAGRSSII